MAQPNSPRMILAQHDSTFTCVSLWSARCGHIFVGVSARLFSASLLINCGKIAGHHLLVWRNQRGTLAGMIFDFAQVGRGQSL